MKRLITIIFVLLLFSSIESTSCVFGSFGRVNLGPGFPTGENEQFGTGFGVNLAWDYPVSPWFYLFGALGYACFGEGSEWEEYGYDVHTGKLTVDVGARAEMSPFDCGFAPYGGISVGPVLWRDTWQFGQNGQEGDDSGTELSTRLHLGTTYPINNSLALDLQFNYRIIFDAQDFEGAENFTVFGINAGLRVDIDQFFGFSNSN